MILYSVKVQSKENSISGLLFNSCYVAIIWDDHYTHSLLLYIVVHTVFVTTPTEKYQCNICKC